MRGWSDSRAFCTLVMALDVLPIAESSLCNLLTLSELYPLLTKEGAEADSRMAKIYQLEERVCAAEDDSEALHVPRTRVD